jgi:hypothetical protein
MHTREIRTLAPAIARYVQHKATHVTDILVELLAAFLNPDWKLGKSIDTQFVLDFAHQLILALPHGTGPLARTTARDTPAVIAEIRAVLSPVGFGRTVASASDTDLSHAQEKWIGFWSGIDDLIYGINPPKDRPGLGNVFAAGFALVGIPLLLPTPV